MDDSDGTNNTAMTIISSIIYFRFFRYGLHYLKC